MVTKRKVRTNAKTENRAERPERTPVSGARNILNVRGIPDDKVARWVNDVDDNILRFKNAGYEFWLDTNVSVGDKTVNTSSGVGSPVTKPVGNGIIAYLMVQNKDWYNEDQAAKSQELNEQEADMFRELNNERDGRYKASL